MLPRCRQSGRGAFTSKAATTPPVHDAKDGLRTLSGAFMFPDNSVILSEGCVQFVSVANFLFFYFVLAQDVLRGRYLTVSGSAVFGSFGQRSVSVRLQLASSLIGHECQPNALSEN